MVLYMAESHATRLVLELSAMAEDNLLPCVPGLFVPILEDPVIEPIFKPVSYVEALADIHEELEVATEREKVNLYLELSLVFRGLDQTKLLYGSLYSALQHAKTNHEKLVVMAWIINESYKGDIQDITNLPELRMLSECAYLRIPSQMSSRPLSPLEEQDDVVFNIRGEKISCNRQKISLLSAPLHAMLNGCFSESQTTQIEFSQNIISPMGMKIVDEYSKTGKFHDHSVEVSLEVLAFSNRFLCADMKDASDVCLAAKVQTVENAICFIEYALEENAQALIAKCLHVLLCQLPKAFESKEVVHLFCSVEGKNKLNSTGHSSFALYCLLCHFAIENDIASNFADALLQRIRECASSPRQKGMALHQHGCVMFARKQYEEALRLFEKAVEMGHAYSLVGVARARCKCGNELDAYVEATALTSCYTNTGWMYQEVSLYCTIEEKLRNLDQATELDPTLTYPYKFRAARFMDEQNAIEALKEINRILCFKLAPDCLEVRIYIYLALKEFVAAERDLHALLALDPLYEMCFGDESARQLLKRVGQLLNEQPKTDLWTQLCDVWLVDDLTGSLAIVHQMLESGYDKSTLYFRQFLLFLRLNCEKAALQSLKLAWKYANAVHERLVYEGWIFYYYGDKIEALHKANDSIAIIESFEAVFLKASSTQNRTLSLEVLKEALKCPSDVMRKGQALFDLGDSYVSCNKLELAVRCYIHALKVGYIQAHKGLAQVHFLQGDTQSAYNEMTKLIERTYDKSSAYEKRSEYCANDMQMQDLNMVTVWNPLRTYPYRYTASVLMDNRKSLDAISFLTKVINFKLDSQLIHLRAIFYELVGDYPSALCDCHAALLIDSFIHCEAFNKGL